MDSLIEKYLRDTGIKMRTWKKNGCVVKIYEQEKLIHTLLSSYIRKVIIKEQTNWLKDKNDWVFSCSLINNET